MSMPTLTPLQRRHARSVLLQRADAVVRLRLKTLDDANSAIRELARLLHGALELAAQCDVAAQQTTEVPSQAEVDKLKRGSSPDLARKREQDAAVESIAELRKLDGNSPLMVPVPGSSQIMVPESGRR